jgi:hypothetical protein
MPYDTADLELGLCLQQRMKLILIIIFHATVMQISKEVTPNR